MSTIATLAVKLIGDITGYTTAMTQAEQKSQKTAAAISKNFKDVGQNLTNVGQKATAGLTLPIVALGAVAINAASDLDETKNKVNVVFGEMSQSVLEWSKTSATALGQSQEQALAAAGTYGNLFTSLGLGQQPAAEMSMSLVQLASDLASFNNADPSQVLDALRSGLSGEVEPLKKFGIAMNEATLKAKAMELGMGDNIQALTEAQKLQLRYAIIMGQTATAQGDFARTSGGLANQQRILKAQFTDAAAALGTQLLPLALQFVTFLSGLIQKFSELSPGMQKFILIILAIAAAAGPVLMVIGSIASGVGALIPVITALGPAIAVVSAFITGTAIPAIASLIAALAPVVVPILAIIAVLALLYLAWKNNFLGIQDTVTMWVDVIKNLWGAFLAFLRGDTSVATDFLKAAFDSFGERFNQVFEKVFGIKDAWGSFIEFIKTTLTTIVAPVTLVISFIDAMRNGLVLLHEDGSGALADLAVAFGFPEEPIQNLLGYVWWFLDLIKQGKSVTEALSTVLRDAFAPAFDRVASAIANMVDWVQGLINKLHEIDFGLLTPGSPTPFEVGLWGVNDALRAVSREGLPGMEAGLGFANSGSVPGVGGGGGLGMNNSRVVELLEIIARKQGIDENMLGRIVRDGVMQAGTRR